MSIKAKVLGSLFLLFAMSLKIHTFPNNPRANKALIAAEYGGVKVETVIVEMGKDNKSKQFLAINPFGKVPTLETPEGGVFESNAIARYVARAGNATLFGKTPLEAAQVDQWLDWVRGDLELAGSVWLYPIWGIIPNNPAATAQAKQDIKKNLAVVNTVLSTRSYLVGERISLADIVVACTLLPMYTTVFDAVYRKAFPHVNRWFDNLVNQPNFKKVQGEVVLCVEEKQAPAWVPKVEAKKEKAEDLEDIAAAEEKPKGKVSATLNPTFIIPHSSYNVMNVISYPCQNKLEIDILLKILLLISPSSSLSSILLK
jgi:elongation factor 1-gamma